MFPCPYSLSSALYHAALEKQSCQKPREWGCSMEAAEGLSKSLESLGTQDEGYPSQ